LPEPPNLNTSFFGGERVARRDGANGAGGVFYYFSDHLKTASVVTILPAPSNPNRVFIHGAANSSSPTTIPITTNLPAKNATANLAWIISARDITQAA
jgi:hypothetical protein